MSVCVCVCVQGMQIRRDVDRFSFYGRNVIIKQAHAYLFDTCTYVRKSERT